MGGFLKNRDDVPPDDVQVMLDQREILTRSTLDMVLEKHGALPARDSRVPLGVH